MPRRPGETELAIARREIVQLQRDLRRADLRSTDLRFASVRRDTDLARSELKGRLDLLNELRGNVVSREEFNLKVDGLDKALDTLKEDVNGLLSGQTAVAALQARQLAIISVLLLVVAIIAGLVGHFVL